MTGFIVSVFPFRNRVSSKEAFEGLELGDGKPSRPVLRGPGGRKAAWLLGTRRNGPSWLLAKRLSSPYLCCWLLSLHLRMHRSLSLCRSRSKSFSRPIIVNSCDCESCTLRSRV